MTSKAFVVTRMYMVKVPQSHLDQIAKDHPDTSVEADLIDAATRFADTGDLKGRLWLLRNTGGGLSWDSDYDSDEVTVVMEADYEVAEVDVDYSDSYVEVDYICTHCNTVNKIIEGTDPGEYRCCKCVEWL